MKAAPETKMNKAKKFLVVRLSSLGDIIHTLPAYSALRRNYPEAEIRWLVEPKGKEILDLVPGIDRVITVELKRWKPGSLGFRREFLRLREEIRDRDQVALDFQGLVKSGFLAFISGAGRRLGFHRKNLREPLASMFYTEHLAKVSEEIHVIEKNLKLLSLLGVEENAYDFPLVLPEGLRGTIRKKLRGMGLNGEKKLILLNVGAAWKTKRWYADRWVRLIRTIGNEGIFPLLLWGSEEERELAGRIGQETGVALAPPLKVAEAMALIKEASLVVSGDTFALQAACALSRPVVGLFGPTNPRRNGPFKAGDRIVHPHLECGNCYKRVCAATKCLDKITVEEVVAACSDAMEENA
jgi:heptosyltransferase-1